MADTQINVGMNVDGVTTGTEKVKRSLKDLGTSARDASNAVGGMGDGGAKSAEKVEAATRSMIGSIQRQIAATEAGDKSSRKYQESLAKMRGVDTNALKPYLDQLDAAKAKQDGLTASLGSIGTAAFAAATAFVAVGSGIAAMTKQVVDGLDALNDLKDATGASIENISALEDVALRTGANFDVVSTSLIKLNQGLNSAKPGSDTEAALKAIGLSVKDLKDMDPAEAFQKIAVGLSGFADDANKARITQELFGKSLKEVAPLLKDVAENGKLNGTVTTAQAEAAERLNKQMFNLQKNALDVRRAFVSDLIPAISDAVDRFILAQKHAGSLLGVLAMYNRLDYSKGIQGNLGEVEKQIAALEERATRITSAGAKTGNDKLISDLKAQAAYLKELRQMKILAEQEDASDAVSRKYSKPKPTIGDLPDQAAIKAAAAEAKKAVAEQNKELAAQSKLLAENAGLTGSFSEDWSRLVAIYKIGKINLSELTAAQAKLLSNQPAIKAANDAEAKSAAELEKANMAALDARQKYNEYLDKGLSSIQDENQKIQDHIDRLGLNKEAIAELDAQRLESQAVTQDLIVLKKIEQGLDESQYEIYVKTSAELRKQAALRRSSASKESEIEAAKEVAKASSEEWKRGWEETDRLARDAFTAWATDGSNAAQKIGDTLKKALLSAIYEATIKPIAFQLYTSIAGGGGAAGAVQGASNALSGGSSLAGAFGNAAGLFGQGFKAGFGSIFGESGILGGVSAGTTAIGAGNIAGGLGTLAGAIGPVVVGLAALKSAMDYKVEATGSAIVANLGGGVTNVANRNDYRQTGGLFGGGTTHNSDWSAASAETTAYFDAQVKAVTEAARAYGTALGLPVGDLDSFKQQIEVSLTGLNADQAKEAINKAVAGFGDAMVSANFGPAIDSMKKGGETASATLVRVANEITTVNSTLGMLGGKLLSVDAAGIKAADGLVQAMGGLEAFQQQTASYYESYYSEEEKRMQTALSIQARLAQGGIDVSIEQVLNGTREQFRKLVDSFKEGGGLMTEAGQAAVAALMAVAGAFAGITTASPTSQNAASTTAPGGGFEPYSPEWYAHGGNGAGSGSSVAWSGGGASEAANAILEERKSLQDQLDELTMTNTQLLEKQRNAIDESNRALWDQVQAAKAAAAAAEERKGLQEQYNQLTMTETQLRELERETIAESNRELFDRITAIKAEQAAIAEANTAVDNAFAAVQRAIDAEKKSIEAARQAAQERVGILKSIVDSIGSAVDSLRGNVESTKAQAARQANAFIDNALATAQASGYMPDADELKDAISKATAGLGGDGKSEFERARDALVLAGKLEALGTLAKPQLTAAEEAVKLAESQLQALDDQLAAAKESIDALRGIDTSVKTVAEAIAALAAALLAAKGAMGSTYTPKPTTPLPNIGGISQTGLSYAKMKEQAVNLSNWYGTDTTGAGTALYNAATRYGYTSDDLDKAMGWAPGHALQWALAHGLAAFDVGTNMVPRDMIAQIHEGEAIIPKAYNPAAGGTSGNARLESLVEGLTKEVQRLQSIVNDGNKSNNRIADAVNGSPEMPMLVTTV